MIDYLFYFYKKPGRVKNKNKNKKKEERKS